MQSAQDGDDDEDPLTLEELLALHEMEERHKEDIAKTKKKQVILEQLRGAAEISQHRMFLAQILN